MWTTHGNGHRHARAQKRQPSEFNGFRDVSHDVSEQGQFGFKCIHHEVRTLDGYAHHDIELYLILL
jgi:hypothetical protein